MIRKLALPLALGIGLAACTTAQVQTTLAKPVPVAVTSDAQTALASYQTALGLAIVATRGNPGFQAKVLAFQAKAAPYVAAVQSGVDQAAAAPSLAALAAEMLVEAGPFITATPNG